MWAPLEGNSFLELPSLSLAPPNRPVKQLYSNILAAPSWPPRLSLLATLGDPHPTTSGHRVAREAWGSTGCVNALDWEQGGEGRLASAGDDTKICIWKPGVDPSTSDDSATSPSLHLGWTEVIDTGHRANIFSVKWAPYTPTRLFSCAGDSTVRVYDLSLASNPTLSSSTVFHSTSGSAHPPWTHHEAASACTRVLRCHTSQVKRVSTENSPDVFLTCSEDGTVRQHDLRTTHTCRRPGMRSDEAACGPPLVEYQGLSLYSLSVSKQRPHLFVVAGTAPYAFLHDRRMLREPMKRDWGIEASDEDLTQCVRRFGVPKEDGKGEASITKHVVATKLSSSNPRDLLVSYSGAGVFLFDTDADPHVPPERVAVPDEAKSKEKEDNDVMLGSDDELTESPSTVPEKRPREDDGSDQEGSPSTGPHLEEAAAATEEEEGERAGTDDSGDDSDDDEAFARLDRFRSYHSDVPLIAPRREYSGHRNETTVKDVNFAFGNDSFVVSGSDDGNWFVWDKESEELVGIFEGDGSVVNVLQSHPRLPLIAISGIDPTVKIFGPTSDLEERGNLVEKAEEIIARNRSEEGRQSSNIMSVRCWSLSFVLL
ncbi:WD40-repeat-containing domain protein [Leucosporidium creatinivorum]|uniref:WD40-repeat-containing domain protein n=1 Tax=Leucosporidium creatinivorum TaxID=106004 RepID=A0A1Y2EQP3_9BASI|nr:WD40-repeat-containing domain protein [Leucosporidium creatinivorum]